MKKNREELKAEFLAEALFDQLMVWDEHTSKPDMTQIEEIVLQLRQRLRAQGVRPQSSLCLLSYPRQAN